MITPATASAPYIAEAPSFKTSSLESALVGIKLELTVIVGTKSSPIFSVWYPALLTILLPFKRTRVLPTPILLKLYAPTSPLAALTPPEICSASLKKFKPCSTRLLINSSPSLVAIASISSALKTVTGRAPVMLAPLICDPTVITSSTSDEFSASWAKA